MLLFFHSGTCAVILFNKWINYTIIIIIKREGRERRWRDGFGPSKNFAWRPLCHISWYMDVHYRLSARGLTYNNNSGQLSIEYLRPDPTSQFSKRIYPTERQLRQHVATQVRRETSPAPPGCTTHCPNPKPDPIPTFTGGVSYVYHDVAKVTPCYNNNNNNNNNTFCRALYFFVNCT